MKYEYRKYRLEIVEDANVMDSYDYQVSSSEDVQKFLNDICRLNKNPSEHFIAIAINARGNIIGYTTVSIGDLCSSVTHPREVFKFAVCCNAGSVVFAHNHPSGDPSPSDADIASTKRLIEAGEILGIPVLDHIVIGSGDKYISMRAKNLI